MNHGNTSWYFPLDGSSVSDDSSPVVSDHRSALKEIARGQSLVRQLLAIVLPALQEDNNCSQVAAQILEGILESSAEAMAALKLCQLHGREDDRPVVVHNQEGAGKISDGSKKAKRQQLRRRRKQSDDCVTLETPVPDYDGHQWRKYGEKRINNAKYPRCYFKCAYGQEKDCKATKTVQQRQDDGCDDSPMYTVAYYGQHTCNSGKTGGNSSGDCQAKSDSQFGNISVACTSAVVHHLQTTNSLEGKLMDDVADLITEHELFDMGAYAPLDWDPAWEMDAHGHGVAKFGDS